MSNEAGEEIGGFIGAMGGAMSELGKKMAEQDAQKAAGTHGWVVQPDGTQKFQPLDPAHGRPRVAATGAPARTDDAPASGIPVPPASRLARVRGGQAAAAPEGARKDMGRRAGRPTVRMTTWERPNPGAGIASDGKPFGNYTEPDQANPKGMERP